VFDLAIERDVYVSGDVQHLLGYSREEIAQTPFTSIWHPADLAAAREHIVRSMAAADGEILTMEYRARRLDGSWRRLASPQHARWRGSWPSAS
jgi:PAS domain S-box-containing protein